MFVNWPSTLFISTVHGRRAKVCVPSDHWLCNLFKCYPELIASSVQRIDRKQTDAVTSKHVAQHIARVEAAIKSTEKRVPDVL